MSINDYYIVKTRRRGYGFWKTLGAAVVIAIASAIGEAFLSTAKKSKSRDR